MNALELLNRPMLPGDVAALAADPWAAKVRRLARDYAQQGLPVLNGSFLHSNLREGPAQCLTCNPYRLWEYSSLLGFLAKSGGKKRFLDAGGAGSPLPYVLAEHGHEGVALDLQPWLVSLCRHVAAARQLPLQAVTGDITGQADAPGAPFDLVACVSVIEHVPEPKRPRALANLRSLLMPGGLLYLTFDYGDYQTAGAGPGCSFTEAVRDVEPLFEAVEAAGFQFAGNDPRALPADVLAHRAAPAHTETLRGHLLNLGPVDGRTPWRTLAGYLARRLGLWNPSASGRYARHNFFRLFLRAAGAP